MPGTLLVVTLILGEIQQKHICWVKSFAMVAVDLHASKRCDVTHACYVWGPRQLAGHMLVQGRQARLQYLLWIHFDRLQHVHTCRCPVRRPLQSHMSGACDSNKNSPPQTSIWSRSDARTWPSRPCPCTCRHTRPHSTCGWRCCSQLLAPCSHTHRPCV